MSYENNEQKIESVYSKRIRAGKRRTYFFDVKTTRGNDYFLTITESKKRFNDNGYDRHKVFLYKEDFNKFLNALTETINYVKTELMPDFDFDAYNHDYVREDGEDDGNDVVAEATAAAAAPAPSPVEVEEPAIAPAAAAASHSDDVDKW